MPDGTCVSGFPAAGVFDFSYSAVHGSLFEHGRLPGAITASVAAIGGRAVGYGYQRLCILLRREGWRVNHKRIYRLYREDQLCLRKKPPRRRVVCRKREIRPVASKKNECWSMDFVSDQLFDGRRIRVLTLVDNHTRESLALHVGQGPRHGRCACSGRRSESPGRPGAIRVDNGPESSRRTWTCGHTGTK